MFSPGLRVIYGKGMFEGGQSKRFEAWEEKSVGTVRRMMKGFASSHLVENTRKEEGGGENKKRERERSGLS